MLAGNGKALTTTVNLYPDRPVTIKQDAMHHAVGSNRQVEAVPRLAQVAQSGTEADAVVVVGDARTYARSAGAVVVRTVREASSAAGVVKGPMGRMPRLSVGMVDKDRAVCSMVVILTVDIGLDLAEVRKDLLKAPLLIAARGPGSKVLGDAPVEG